jgi:hypothetical protein
MTELRLWQTLFRQDCEGVPFEEQLELLREALAMDITKHAGEMHMRNKSDVAIALKDIELEFYDLELDTKVQFAISIDRLIFKEYWSEDWYWVCYPDIPFGEHAADHIAVELLDVFVEFRK